MLIDDDEEKIQKKWLKIENKKKILEMIEGYYEEFVNYLRSYDINSLSEEEVSNRFKLIQSYSSKNGVKFTALKFIFLHSFWGEINDESRWICGID